MKRREKVGKRRGIHTGEGGRRETETRKVGCRLEKDKVEIKWEEGDRRKEKGDADWGRRKKKEGGRREKRDERRRM